MVLISMLQLLVSLTHLLPVPMLHLFSRLIVFLLKVSVTVIPVLVALTRTEELHGNCGSFDGSLEPILKLRSELVLTERARSASHQLSR